MIYLLDASALLNDENFSFEKKHKYYTTGLVFAEWKDVRSKSLAESAFASKALVVQDPCPASMQITYDKCGKSGVDLSDADASIIALAIEFRERGEKFTVVTDDYSVQNILKKLKIVFEGVAQPEIKRHKIFKKR